MKNIFDRIERKIIIKNTFFIKRGNPRIQKDNNKIDFSFSGEDPLSEMAGSSDKIFKDKPICFVKIA